MELHRGSLLFALQFPRLSAAAWQVGWGGADYWLPPSKYNAKLQTFSTSCLDFARLMAAILLQTTLF